MKYSTAFAAVAAASATVAFAQDSGLAATATAVAVVTLTEDGITVTATATATATESDPFADESPSTSTGTDASYSPAPTNLESPFDTYYDGICYPTNSSGAADFDAPCNAALAILYECIYGDAIIPFITDPEASDQNGPDYNNLALQGNSTQRLCICESQWFNEIQGCADCFAGHGLDTAGVLNGVGYETAGLSSFSSSYCAVTATPTLAFPDALTALEPTTFPTSYPTTIGSDPLGNNTAVSLYFTPKVTGTAAWYIPGQTFTATGVTPTQSAHTVSGEIVPTAGLAAATAAPVAAAAGVVGIAGLIALL